MASTHKETDMRTYFSQRTHKNILQNIKQSLGNQIAAEAGNKGGTTEKAETQRAKAALVTTDNFGESISEFRSLKFFTEVKLGKMKAKKAETGSRYTDIEKNMDKILQNNIELQNKVNLIEKKEKKLSEKIGDTQNYERDFMKQ